MTAELKVTPNEAKCFQYEIAHIYIAADALRECPLGGFTEYMDILDAKIKVLATRIDTTFGALAKEADVG